VKRKHYAPPEAGNKSTIYRLRILRERQRHDPDCGVFFTPGYASEEYLMQAIRELHGLIDLLVITDDDASSKKLK
jgi:hypothetical protein